MTKLMTVMSKPDAIPWYASFPDAASLAKGVSFQAPFGVCCFEVANAAIRIVILENGTGGGGSSQ
jgi:hypothetical protein